MPPDPLSTLTPLAAELFVERFGAPTAAQALAWPAIAAGRSALVVAPTGSGKTLAAFYWFLSELVSRPGGDEGVEVVYVSPLKALAADIERNLREPLAALQAAARRSGLEPSAVGVAVRTGDTPSRARAEMRRRPPRILVTTPESLYLVLTSPRTRDVLRSVRAVIVDEVHALIPTKRGVHLALSLERLERLAVRPPQRIGLSATVAPLEEAARWLAGRDDQGVSRPVEILDAGERKRLDLQVVSVGDPATLGARGVWPDVARELVRIVGAHRSTLIFCNNRRLAERITAMINAEAGHPLARAHHGSVSREVRHDLEARLKAGELPALVATGSLELGIDVGAIDCVVQLQSPKSVARGLQRVGRAGHLVGATAKGRIVGTFRADLLESAAIARAMGARRVEATRAPERCLDVLAQQVVAEVGAAGTETVSVRELYAMARRAWPYRALEWDDFVAVVEMLAGRHSAGLFREARPRIDWDRRRGRVAALPGTRAIATSRPGTIPDRGLYRVEHQETRERLGELDEEFVFESRVGDVFVLGSTSWRIARIARDRVVVRPAAPGEPARMPFWRGEGLGRTSELGRELGATVRELVERIQEGADAAEWARRECACDEASARTLVDYLGRQRDAAGAVPDDRTVVVERYRDDIGDARVALLSPFGGRVHAAWSTALAVEARRRLGLDVPMVPTDDGILMRVPDGDAAEKLLESPRWLRAADVASVLSEEIEGTSLYAALFRDAAQRSLILPGRGRGGRTPLWLARLRAADLAQLMRGQPRFPIAREARREALDDVLDVRALVSVLGAIEKGEIRIAVVRRTLPSPFAAQLQLGFAMAFLYEADSPRVERRARALAAGREAALELLPPDEIRDLLEPDAVAAVTERRQHLAAGTRARTPEELAEILRRLGDLGDAEAAARYDGDEGVAGRALAALAAAGRVVKWSFGGRAAWILDEDLELWRDAAGERGGDAGRLARAEVVRRWGASHGPFTVDEVVARYGFGHDEVAELLGGLERDGVVARGHFVRASGDAQEQWCDRRNLAEAHRRTLHALRDRGAPATMAQLASFLVDRQRAPDVASAVALLGGVRVPAETLERDLLWRRVPGYHPALLDAACAAGDAAWWLAGDKLSIAPRGDLGVWVSAAPGPEAPDAALSPEGAAVLAALDARGALFGPELLAATRLAPAALFRAVWQLVQRGVVTNDSFDAFRRAFLADFDPVRAGLEVAAGRGSIRQVAHAMRRGPWVGRFARVAPLPLSPEERAARQAMALLRRYGVVGKPLVEAEANAVPWPELEGALRDLELRGEVTRGRFVDGLGAYQVAIVGAVDELRAGRDPAALALLNACDPACVFAAIASRVEGRIARLPSSYLVLRGGSPLLLIESYGRRITPLEQAPDEVLTAGLATLRALLAVPASLRGIRSIVVHQYGEGEAAGAEALFRPAGFERDYDRMVLSAT